MPKALFVLSARNFQRIYSQDVREKIERLVHIYAPLQTRKSIADNQAIVTEAEVLLTGWESVVLDQEFMSHAVRLKAVLHGAGSIRSMVTDAFWESGAVISNAAAANAIPVSEYNLSQALFSLKRGWHHVRGIHPKVARGSFYDVGVYRSTVGIISLGLIGQRTADLLGKFAVTVIAYDPYASDCQHATMVSSLEELFAASDVCLCCTPLLPETTGMIGREHFAAMKYGASFINSARGAIVREQEMIAVLQERDDLVAVLDVTSPEPPEPRSPLRTMRNVILTPHMAGSRGQECRRMGEYVLDELKRWLTGEPLKYRVTQETINRMA